MGGPWRARGFDPVAWHPPTPRAEPHPDAEGAELGRNTVTWIVVTYVASVLTSFAVTLGLMRYGW